MEEQAFKNVNNCFNINLYSHLRDISGLYYKQVTIIIYDRNDSGQYFKTTITIVFDDPSLS
jgi:hypothetical protein